MPSIALFGRRSCRQVQAIARAVGGMGGTAVPLDICLSREEHRTAVVTPDRIVWDGEDLTEVPVFYVRGAATNTLPTIPPVLNATAHAEWRHRFLDEQARQAATYSMLAMAELQGKHVVNPLHRYVVHETKPSLYERLRRGGISVPPTLTTSDPEAAQAFLTEHGQVVAKPGAGIGSTRLVSTTDGESWNDLQLCPVVLQKYVKGDVLRLHVVGDEIALAVRIECDTVDSRTAPQGFTPVSVPAGLAQQIRQAHDLLSLRWATWDVLSPSTDEWYLIDCNPGGYFMWLGDDLATQVAQALATYLLECAAN